MESEEKNEPQKDSKERSYSEKIASAVKAQLDQANVRYAFDEEQGIIAFIMTTPPNLPKLNYLVHIDDDGFNVLLFLPDYFPFSQEKRILAVAEFVTRVNHLLRHGRFEIDHSDGETRFFLRVDCGGSIPSEQRVYWAVVTAGLTTLQYAPALSSVAKGDMSPREAIEATESSLGEMLSTLNNHIFDMFANRETFPWGNDDEDDDEDDGDEDEDGSDD